MMEGSACREKAAVAQVCLGAGEESTFRGDWGLDMLLGLR